MALFIFEGDLSNLAEPQIDFIKSIFLARGFNDGKVVVEPVGQKGDNYIADVKRFIYEGNDGTTFKIIGKIAPVAEELRMVLKTKELFENEIIMYEGIIPKFNEIQRFANLPEDEKVKFPICYGCLKEAPYELILLEDLNESGFEMLNRFNPLSDDSVRVVMKDLARYHALSYALKNKEPETFKKYANKLFNMFAQMDVEQEAFQVFVMAENDVLQTMQDAGDKYKNLLKGSLEKMSKISKKMETYERGSKYSVILQGDCWSNNILFRFVDGKPIQDIMIDYQLLRESIPVVDLLYFMFNCTDHATRLKHYQEWIDLYHENLDEALNNYGLQANRIFPRHQLDAEIRKYSRLMISICVIISLMLVRESKDAVDFKELTGPAKVMSDDMVVANMSLASMNMETIIKLKAKLIGIIDTAFEFGLV